MDISPDNKLIMTLRPSDLAEYLQLLGWAEADTGHSPWRIFTHNQVIPGEVIETVLPRRGTSVEGRMHIASSVNLLSRLGEEEPETIVQRVQYRHHDVLRIRNTETQSNLSLDLDIAAAQVTAMKMLVSSGACSEDVARPFFPKLQGKNIKPMLRHYQFGHTFPGSFGFTLTSLVQTLPIRYTQSSLFPDEQDTGELIIAPLERRIMERIIRGLQDTQEAVQIQQPEKLAERYPGGFNANMAQAIVDMSIKKQMPLEYRIFWSPRIPSSDDIQQFEQVRLNSPFYASLETASSMLRRTEPDYKPIRGRVMELRSSDNPWGTDSQRTVVVQWLNKDVPGPKKVIVALESQDYQQALHAHGSWDIVEITGLLQRYGNYWKLSEPRNFHVVG
jgi:hypothetical protein